MEIKVLALLLVGAVLITGCIGGENKDIAIETPETPITISLSIPADLSLNEVGDINITVSSVLDSPDTRIDLILPEGTYIVSGKSMWYVNLTANTPATFSKKIMMTRKGNWEIKAIAKRIVDQENIWGDMDIVYLNTTDDLISVPFAVPDSASADVENISGDLRIVPDQKKVQANISSLTIVPPALDIKQGNDQQYNNYKSSILTVSGTFSYYTKSGDYRDVSNTLVRAKYFLTQVLDGNGNNLGFGYTDSNGYFSISVTNPGNAGIQVRWYTYVKYSPNDYELMTVNPGGSSWKNAFYTYTPTMVLPDGNQNIGNWNLQQGNVIEGAYWIKDDLDRAFRSTPVQPGSGIAEWSYTSKNGTYYKVGGHISLSGIDRMSPDAVVHEYGHNVMYNLYGRFPKNDCPSPHYIGKIGGSNCGWFEGWADFFPLYVNGNPTFTWPSGAYINLETPTWGKSGWDNGDKVEGRVAGALWDIYDGINDGNDRLTDGFGNIWYTIYHQKDDGTSNDNTFAQYWNALRLRYYQGYGAKAALFQNTIDYNNAPNTPYNPSPRNGVTNKLISPVLSWSGGDPDGDTVTYTVYLDTSSNPTTQKCSGTLTSCSVSGISRSTTYYWKVVASDGLEITSGPVWRFKTQTSTTATVMSISNITLGPNKREIVPIMINNVINAASTDIILSYNSSIVHIAGVTNSSFDVLMPSIDNATGMTRIAAFQTVHSGLSGDIKLADVTLKAAGSAGDKSPLNLSVITLKDTLSSPIPSETRNGTSLLTGGVCGNVNDDNSVDITDAMWLAKHVMGIPGYPINEVNSDVNRDGTIDIADAMWISKYVTGGSVYPLKCV